jgi:hypothetical protein
MARALAPVAMTLHGGVSLLVLCGGVACSGGPAQQGESGNVEQVTPALGSYAGPAVATQHNDPARSGQNLMESGTAGAPLTHAVVGGANFGKVYTKTVRGSLYAQPLYVPNVGGLPGVSGVRNVVYVATMHNVVYALDADDPTRNPYWTRSLGPSIALPDPEFIGFLPGEDYRDIWGEVGILSTPVIDTASGVMFAVATTKNTATSAYRHDLFKMRISDGALLASTQVTSGASDFSKRHSQRTSLLLQGGAVFVGFASYADQEPYAGHVFAFNASTMQQIQMFRTTPLQMGGVWMAGEGLTGDGTSVYFVTGNGEQAYNSQNPLDPNGLKLGQSVVQMKLNGTAVGSTFTVQSWFSPSNYWTLSLTDSDVGSAGVTLVPGTNRLVAGGKEGVVYLLERGALGYLTSNDAIPQRFRIRTPPPDCDAWADSYASSDCNHIHGSPVFFRDDTNTLRMYIWAENDVIRGFRFNDTAQRFECGGLATCDDSLILKPPPPTAGQVDGAGIYGMPGGMLSVSASGNTNGIIWATHAANVAHTVSDTKDVEENAAASTVDGVVVAYNAKNLTELWNSEKNRTRDDLGAFVKFSMPTPVGGQVFVPTNAGISNKVIVTTAATSDRGPAIATLGTGASSNLVYAFKTKPTSGSSGALKVLNSTASDGMTFSAVTNLPSYVTNYEPAMVGDGARVYLAWTNSADSRVKVISSVNANFSSPTTINLPTSETSDAGPALAFGNNRVFLAWKEPVLGLLRIMSATAGGTTFGSKVSTLEWANATPSLYYSGGKLYLAWRDIDNYLNVMYSTDNGATFSTSTMTTYSNTTIGSGPSLVGLPTSTPTGAVTDLYMMYSNDDAIFNESLLVATAENSVTTAFGYAHRMWNIETPAKPATTVWNGKAYVAYTDYNCHVWVGRWSPGELVAYGKIQ